MTAKLIVGLDGSGSGGRAVEYAKKLAKLMGGAELILVYVIEWSPFSFQTPEENAERHKRREQEVEAAETRVVSPAVKALKADGLKVGGLVKHGHVAETLDRIAREEKADQIVVGRTSDAGLANRIFGSSTANLVMHASVPVTVVG